MPAPTPSTTFRASPAAHLYWYVQQKSLLPFESTKFDPQESFGSTAGGVVPGTHWYAYEFPSHGNPGKGAHGPPAPGHGKQQ
jgi:hypothetical protein